MKPGRMYIIALRDVIISVPERWRRVYQEPNAPLGWMDREKEAIYHKLRTLDTSTSSTEDIANIIGNDSWTSLTCDGCDKQQTILVRIGEEANYKTRWLYLCLSCLKEAVKYLEGG